MELREFAAYASREQGRKWDGETAGRWELHIMQ